jgi:TRAP transporter TAXI family solute receptor
MSGAPAPNVSARALLVAGLAIVLSATACQPLGEGEGDGDAGDASVAASGPAASDGAAAGGGQLVIATGGTGGVYYPLGGGLANVISDNVTGYTATISETNASVDNMLLIADGGADIAFSLGDTAADAVNGAGADFEGNPVDACALARIYDNFTQVVTSADSGIASIEDLRDKRVSLGSPGSGTEVIALRMLEAAGIDPDGDIQRQQLGIDETVAALRDGTIDAGFWSGGLPTGALVEYATSGDLVLIPNGELASPMAEQYGDVYIEDVIPAGSYEGQDEDVSTVVVPNVLVVNSSMPEDLQQDLTAVIFDHKDELVSVHDAANAIELELAQDVGFMEICPGSQAYYDEQG